MDERAQAIAEKQAEHDRELLARLVAAGKVIQTSESPLTRAVASINRAKRERINLAIRPKSKRRRR